MCLLAHFSTSSALPFSDLGEGVGSSFGRRLERRQSRSAEATVMALLAVTLDRAHGGHLTASDGWTLGAVHCLPVHALNFSLGRSY